MISAPDDARRDVPGHGVPVDVDLPGHVGSDRVVVKGFLRIVDPIVPTALGWDRRSVVDVGEEVDDGPPEIGESNGRRDPGHPP